MSSATYPDLAGKRAFVTGGATGIGASIVRAYAHQGTIAGFVDIDENAGNALLSELRDEGLQVWFAPVDVTDTNHLKQAIGDFSAAYGPIAFLVNNVANDTRHDWRTLTRNSWDAALSVNLTPAFFAIQAVVEGMLERRAGSIVNFGSISWKAKHGGMPAYTTAKAAIHGMTRSFVSELGSAGVRINTVVPGWVLTERQIAEHYEADGADIISRNQPLTGTIKPEHVASLVMFLSSDDSAMCTGQEFTIDGGWI